MSIFRKYHEELKYDLIQSKGEIIEKVTSGKNKSKNVYDFLTDNPIETLKVYILPENELEIPIEPTMFNPFKGTGKIRISLIDNRINLGTEVKTEIIPYNEGYIATVILLLTFLIIWTIVAFIISTNIYTFIMVLLGWTIFPFILYITPFQNRKKLRKYREGFISKLKKKSTR